jgi:hypothetical protein
MNGVFRTAAHSLTSTKESTTMVRPLASVALLAMVLGGCARTIASSTPYKQLPPKASAEDVEVYTDARPDRAYEELGLIEVKKFGFGDGYGQLVMRAKQEAARMGADAIIVSRRPHEITNTSGGITNRKYGRGQDVQISTSTTEEPRISVTAIVWKAPRSQ